MGSTSCAVQLRRKITVPDTPFYTPSGVLIELAEKTLMNSQNIPRMANRFQNIRHTSDKRLEVFLSEDRNSVRIAQSSDDYNAEIMLPSTVLKNGLPEVTKKIFRFIMTKICQTSFINGQLVQSFIEFNLQELVDYGFYRSIDSARNHIFESLDFLLCFNVGGSRTVGKGKNKKVHSWDHGNLFINHSMYNNIVRIDLNPVKDWNFLISQYQVMPFYLYTLSSRAYALCEAVFYYSRVNAKKFIKKDGELTISNRVIQQYLDLPDISDTKNPGRDIKQAVEKAVDEINACEKYTAGFELELYSESSWSVADWLSKGYLIVQLGEQYLQIYKNIATKRAFLINKVAGK